MARYGKEYKDRVVVRLLPPESAASGKIMLRVAPTVHAAALKAAARSGISLNKWAEQALSAAAHLPADRSTSSGERCHA